MINLTTAIVSKASGSSFLTSIGSRLRNGRAEDSETYPYCVFYLPISDDPQILSTFDRHYEDIDMQFSIFSDTHSPSEALTIYGYLIALYDDCTLSITGRTLIKMERTNHTLIPEDHTTPDGVQRVWHVPVDYKIVTKVG